MKAVLFSFFFLISGAAWCQHTYVFDYCTLYEYTKNEKGKDRSYELTFSNSLDPNIHFIVLEEDAKVFTGYIVDYTNKMYYEFDNLASLATVEKTVPHLSKSAPLNLDYCKQARNFYEFTGSDTIHIKRYKKADKKKLINECVVVVVPTPVTKLQRYNFGPFRNPLFCGKFDFSSEGLIEHCYFVENGKKKHIRKLQQIKTTNFTVTVPKPDNTKK